MDLFYNFRMNLKLQRYESDSCVYFRKQSNGNIVYLLLYLYDMLLARTDIGDLMHFKQLLKTEFNMKV